MSPRYRQLRFRRLLVSQAGLAGVTVLSPSSGLTIAAVTLATTQVVGLAFWLARPSAVLSDMPALAFAAAAPERSGESRPRI